MRPVNRDGFEIAIICALPFEADPIEALFEEPYDKFGRIYGKQYGDHNTYFTGRIGQHHVVLCFLPDMGKGSAAAAASNLRMSYKNIQLALVVGVCGGNPFPTGGGEIILGDVIISNSVVQYDFGKQNPDGFRPKSDVMDTLGRPIPEIRSFLRALSGRNTLRDLQREASAYLHALQKDPEQWKSPGIEHDVLFEASHRHKHYRLDKKAPCICIECNSDADAVCDAASKGDCTTLGCSGGIIRRTRLDTGATDLRVHIGKVASADTVMQSGSHRDKIAAAEDVIAFEMEGAGVWDNLPCIIIKGVCDYADSHKNKHWQDYAAATAASVSKAFLQNWRPVAFESCIATEPTISNLTTALHSYYTGGQRLHVHRISGDRLPMDRCYINMVIVERVRAVDPTKASELSLFSRLKVETVEEEKHIGICELFVAPRTSDHGAIPPRRILIHGRAGVGKTTLCKKIIHDHINDGLWSDIFDMILWIPLRSLNRRSQQNNTLKGAFYDLYFAHLTDGDDLALQLEKRITDSAYKNRILLILDGLDEVSQEWEPGTPMHNLLIRLLDHPRVIVTSRPYGLGNSALESFDMYLETVGFSEDQVEAYVKMTAKGDPEISSAMLAFVTGNKMIRHLVRIPVQLDAVCYSWDRHFMYGDSPKTMTLLYKAITLKLWQKDVPRLNELDASKGLTEDSVRSLSMLQIEGLIEHEVRLVEILAFAGMCNGLVEFSANDRERLYDALTHEQAETPLPEIPESIFRKVSFLHTSDPSTVDSDQTYHFLHLTFQEFFAARYFVRHWMADKELECINLKERPVVISFTQPQAYLQMHKYNSRYDIMWRFTTGLIQEYVPLRSGREDPVKHYFDQLDSEPRDILGPVHQRLLMHCLGEVVPGMRSNVVRATIANQLLPWLQLQSQMGIRGGITSDDECPEHLLVRLLHTHVNTTVLRSLYDRKSLSLATLERVLAIIKADNTELRLYSATCVLVRQINLPPEILKAMFSLRKSKTKIDQCLVNKLVQQVGNFPELVEHLPKYQKSDNWHVRLNAGIVLARQPSLPPGGLDALLLLLQDPEKEVRAGVAEGLCERQPLESVIIEALFLLLNDEDYSVRAAAAKVWGSQDHIPPEVRHTLHLLLQDEVDAVKVNAAFALSRHRPVAASTLSVLVLLLKKSLWSWWLEAPMELQGLDSSMELQGLDSMELQVLDSLEEQEFLPPDIVEVLVALLEDGPGHVNLTIARILSQQPPSLTMEVQTLLHDYSILRLYMDAPGRQAQLMPTSHRSSMLRMFRGPNRCMALKAASALSEQSHLSQDILGGVVQMLIADDDRSEHASWILSRQSVLPTEIKNQLSRLLENKCSDRLMCYITDLLYGKTGLPPQMIGPVVALARKDTSHLSVALLSEQTNLPPPMLEEVLPLLNSKRFSTREEIAILVMKNTESLSGIPAKYWGPLYKQWVEKAFREQLSCILNNSCLRLNGADGVGEVHFSRMQLIDFRHQILKAQLELGIPADTVLPKTRGYRSISRLVYKTGALLKGKGYTGANLPSGLET